MKRTALLVVLLYGLILVAFAQSVVTLGFWGTTMQNDGAGIFTELYYWIWFAVMVACQAALLVVPVRIAEARPVTRRALFWPIVAGALAMGILAAGFIFMASEIIFKVVLERTTQLIALSGLIVMWIVWALIFSRWSKKEEPCSFIRKLTKTMYRGSVLEFLVAVPSHIVARQREYCCAGVDTFLGLVFGLSVMVFSFGPGVFFLYADKIKKLKPKQ